jgi:hypothetical protein
MEARPGSFRYFADGRSATSELNEHRVSTVPFESSTFLKAVVVNLPETGSWSVQEIANNCLVISRRAIDPGVSALCAFFSTLFGVIAIAILVSANRPHHDLSVLGVIYLISLAFGFVLPFLFLISLRRDRRLVLEMVSTGATTTKLFVEPCPDEQLNNFVHSLVERLVEFAASVNSAPESGPDSSAPAN